MIRALLLTLLTLSIFAPEAAAVYDPATGRFITRDPRASPHFELMRIGVVSSSLGMPATPTRKGSAQVHDRNDEKTNVYEYVRSNPLTRVDPMGLQSVGWKEASCILLNTAGGWAGLNAAREATNRAIREAQNRFPGGGLHNGPGDAWRHCYWTCLMARNSWVGPEMAREIGRCHENAGDRNGQQPAGERDMDLHNNDVGISIGSARPKPSREGCATGCDDALKDGRLVTSPGSGTPDDDYYRDDACKPKTP
jgi:hypothetical protein